MKELPDLSQRLAYLNLDAPDLELLADLRPILERYADRFVAAFYRHLLSFDDLRRRQHTVASAYVRFFLKHPHMLSRWRGTSQTTAAWCRDDLGKRASRLHTLEAAARTLSDLDLGALESVGGELDYRPVYSPRTGGGAPDMNSPKLTYLCS